MPKVTPQPSVDQPVSPNGNQPSSGRDEPIDPFDLENVRYTEAEFVHGDIESENHIGGIPIRKPRSNHEWIRVHPGPEYQLSASLYERETSDTASGEKWLVPRQFRHLFQEKALTPVILRLAVTSLDAPFLWDVKRPRKGNRNDAYFRSLDDIVADAEVGWVMVDWNNSSRAYDHKTAPEDLGEAKFPEMSMGDLIRLGFNGRAIDRADHPVVLEHQGRKPKSVDKDAG